MSFFGDIGSALGFGGSGKGAAPSYESVGLDEGTKKLLDQQKERAGRSNEQFASDITKGTEAGQNAMLSDSQMKRQNAALGMYDNDAMRQAIQSRAKKYFDTTQSNIKATAAANAPIRKYQATNAVMSDFMQQQQNFNHNVMMQNEAKMNKVKARNNAISSIFGGLGNLASLGATSSPQSKSSMTQNSGFEGGYAGSDTNEMSGMA